MTSLTALEKQRLTKFGEWNAVVAVARMTRSTKPVWDVFNIPDCGDRDF